MTDTEAKKEVIAFRNQKWKEIDPFQFEKCFLDINYAGTDDPRQTLDVYLPQKDGVWPVVLFVHGGGYVSGNKRVEHISSWFKIISQGYAVASIEYRLAPETLFPGQYQDVRAAVRYLRAHAAEFQIDTSKLVIWGNSAGANISSMVALPVTNDLFDNPQYGNMDVSAKIDGVISFYGRFSFDITQPRLKMYLGEYADRPETASFFTYLDENYPPILIQHGQKDRTIDWHQSQKGYEKITEVCGPGRATLEYFPEADHGGSEIKANANIQRCVRFLDSIYYPEQEVSYPRGPLPDILFLDK